MATTTGAGITESFAVPGRELRVNVLANVILPSVDPDNNLDPKTAAATITSVGATRPLVLVCTLVDDAAEGESVLFTAPTGTTWKIVDAMAVPTAAATVNSTNSTYSLTANSVAVSTSGWGATLTTGAIRRWGSPTIPADGTLTLAAGEELAFTSSTGDGGTQRGLQATLFLQRTA